MTAPPELDRKSQSRRLGPPWFTALGLGGAALLLCAHSASSLLAFATFRVRNERPPRELEAIDDELDRVNEALAW
ncbi:MAG: hypothetical protein ACYTFG_14035, partial [Planctomycetota bacterium]